MSRILVSRFSGVLSAYGLSAADVVCEKQEACAAEYGEKGGEGPPEVGWVRVCWCWFVLRVLRRALLPFPSLPLALPYGCWFCHRCWTTMT